MLNKKHPYPLPTLRRSFHHPPRLFSRFSRNQRTHHILRAMRPCVCRPRRCPGLSNTIRRCPIPHHHLPSKPSPPIHSLSRMLLPYAPFLQTHRAVSRVSAQAVGPCITGQGAAHNDLGPWPSLSRAQQDQTFGVGKCGSVHVLVQAWSGKPASAF